MSGDFIYLASASPRRRDLLKQIGVAVRVLEISVDERWQPGESPDGYVTRLACAKAEAGWVQRGDAPVAPVLAADTAVVVDGAILGKPADQADAALMLKRLSGRSHAVLTAVAVRSQYGVESRLSSSVVSFRQIGAAEAERYWHSGEPRDKAGGYGIQGFGAVFIADLRGSYSGVMGLPLFETAQMLDAAGVPRWMRSTP